MISKRYNGGKIFIQYRGVVYPPSTPFRIETSVERGYQVLYMVLVKGK